jgi:hypothetical protein
MLQFISDVSWLCDKGKPHSVAVLNRIKRNLSKYNYTTFETKQLINFLTNINKSKVECDVQAKIICGMVASSRHPNIVTIINLSKL